VESLVLICPDGVDAPVNGFARMIRTPLVGELAGRLVMNAVGQRRWEERLQGYSADPRLVEDVVRQFRAQLVYEGFWRALVSSIASLPISESSDLFRRIDRQGTRTLVLWGAGDVIIPVHLPQYERPDLTNEAILRFLRRDPAGPGASPESTP
jgi:pimeloyl-ACP methyl ester carboxylesterase